MVVVFGGCVFVCLFEVFCLVDWFWLVFWGGGFFAGGGGRCIFLLSEKVVQKNCTIFRTHFISNFSRCDCDNSF